MFYCHILSVIQVHQTLNAENCCFVSGLREDLLFIDYFQVLKLSDSHVQCFGYGVWHPAQA